MTETTITIDGMSCMHCVGRVKKALEGLQGVQVMEVQIGSAKVTYDEGKIAKANIEKAVVNAGYRVAS